MEQRRLGRFQIEFGWVLIIIGIVSGIVGYWFILNKLVSTFYGLTKTWSDIGAKNVVQTELIQGHVISYALTVASIFYVALILLAFLLLVLFSISVLLITQGTANVNLSKALRQEAIDLIKAKRKFKKSFIISFVGILVGSLLFYSPPLSLLKVHRNMQYSDSLQNTYLLQKQV